MKEPIFLSKRSCNRITAALLLLTVLLPFLFPVGRSNFFYYMMTAAEAAFVMGFFATIATGRYLTSKMKTRLPEWRKEIEQLGFGRFLRTQRPQNVEKLLSILKKDSDFEQIQEERRLVSLYAAFWVYPPMVLVIGIILCMAIFSKSGMLL